MRSISRTYLKTTTVLGFIFLVLMVSGFGYQSNPKTDPQHSVSALPPWENSFPNTLALPWKCGESEPRVVTTDWDDPHYSTGIAADFNAKSSRNADLNTAVLAPTGGTATTYSSGSLGEGQAIDIDAGGGWKVRLLHLQGLQVQNGQAVAKGQTVGYVFPHSQGPHIHMEIIFNGGKPDPLPQWLVGHPRGEFDSNAGKQIYSNNCGPGHATLLFWDAATVSTQPYAHFTGTGPCFNVPEWFDEQASALQLNTEYGATVYENRNCGAEGGGYKTFWGSDTDFANDTFENKPLGVNDNVSSIYVFSLIQCWSNTQATIENTCPPGPTPTPGGPTPTPTPTPNSNWWLLEYSEAENPPLEVIFHVRVAWNNDFDAFRLCFDGGNCQETSATELFYTWNTSSYGDGFHTISVQYRRKSDNGNWGNALKYEHQFYLSPNRAGIGNCDGGDGAYLRAGGECIRLTADQRDLNQQGWGGRKGLVISVVGPYDAWAYDGVDYGGAPRIVKSGEEKAVGDLISSVQLKPAAPPPPPVPTEPFTCDANTFALYHFNGNANDACGNSHLSSGSEISGGTFVSGKFGQAIQFQNPPDGPGVTFWNGFDVCPMSVELWVRRFGDNNVAAQLGEQGGNTGHNKWLLRFNGASLKFELWSAGGSQWGFSAKTVDDNNWHYVMITYDCNRAAKIYLDNELVSDFLTAAQWLGGATTFEIGSAEGQGRFQGEVDEVRISNIVRVPQAPAGPTANFTASATSGQAPLLVNFTDQSTGNILTRIWNFGDGSSSGEQNPSHSFNAPGTYTVALTVEDPWSSDAETKVNYIQVSDPGAPCSNDSFEADNSSDAASVIQRRKKQTHNLCDGTDDWLEFSARRGKKYQIKITKLGANGDTWVELYRLEGDTLVLLAYNDDCKNSLASCLTYRSTAKETLYIRVRSYSPANTGPDSQYTIRVK